MKLHRLAAPTMIGIAVLVSSVPAYAVVAKATPSPAAVPTSTVKPIAKPTVTSKPSPTGSATCQVAHAQTVYDTAITARLDTVSGLKTSLADVTSVPSAQRTEASNILSTNTSGLTALKTQISAATTCAQAESLGQTIVPTYRVYVLVTPQIGLTDSAAAGLAAATSLTAAETAFKVEIKAAQAAGKDVTAEESELTTVETDLPIATADLNPVAGAVLALTPAGYPANRTTLQAQATNTAHGLDELAFGAQAADEIVTQLGS